MCNIISTILLAWLTVTNAAAFAAFGIDKRRAVKERWRIPEKTLMILAAAGGAAGAAAGMLVFHHKTRKYKFSIGIPLLLTVQVLAVSACYIKLFA